MSAYYAHVGVRVEVFYDRDADLAQLTGLKIAVIGYGAQGRAHALNLRDSGVADVIVGLRPASSSRVKAQADGFDCLTPAEAAARCDMAMLLTSDESHAAVYARDLGPSLKSGAALAVAHGFSVHFGLLEPRPDLDVFMAAPKAPGRQVREAYQAGGGVPCLIAVAQDASGGAHGLALAYACAIGGGRAGVIQTSFKEECETDLFGEQAVLCGGLSQLVLAGFETLVEAGYAPEMAYFECLHEAKFIVDLLHEGGFARMRDVISNTAEFGDYSAGEYLIDPSVRERMKQLLERIQSGEFAKAWVLEAVAGLPSFKARRRQSAAHPIEAVGSRLRAMMPWLAKPA
jgi:ketol-acid reductoisomerase